MKVLGSVIFILVLSVKMAYSQTDTAKKVVEPTEDSATTEKRDTQLFNIAPTSDINDSLKRDIPLFIIGPTSEIGHSLSTSSVKFDFESDAIKVSAFFVLDDIAAYLKSHPKVELDIIGYVSNDEFATLKDTKRLKRQRDLSDKRANKVLKYLKISGVSLTQLKAAGKGAQSQIPDTTSEQSRRVEFKIR